MAAPGRAVLVTGASRGIGASVARAFAVARDRVAVHYVTNAAKAHDLVAIVGLIPLAVALYGALLWLLKIEGREEVSQLLAKLRGKGK